MPFEVPPFPIPSQQPRSRKSTTHQTGPQSTIFAVASLARPAFSSASSLAAAPSSRPLSSFHSRPPPSSSIPNGGQGRGGGWLLDAAGWEDVEKFGAREQGIRIPALDKGGRAKERERDRQSLEEEEDNEEGNVEGELERDASKATGGNARGRTNLKRKRTEFVDGMGYLAEEDPFKHLLPNSDLLHSIATHASRFYASHSLSLTPTSSTPISTSNAASSSSYKPVATSSKNLPLLDEAAFLAYQAETSAASSARNKEWRAKRRGEKNTATAALGGEDTGGGREGRDESGEREGADGDGNRDVPSKKAKRGGGKKRRDMFRQLDGDSLIALGVLIEEQVRWLMDGGGAAADGGDAAEKVDAFGAGCVSQEEGAGQLEEVDVGEGRGGMGEGSGRELQQMAEEEDAADDDADESTSEESEAEEDAGNEGESGSDSGTDEGDEFERLFGGFGSGGLKPRGSLEMDEDSD